MGPPLHSTSHTGTGGVKSDRQRFDAFQLHLVQQATSDSSRHLSTFYRYAPREFFHFSYDVLTERDIPPEHLKHHVFAETVRYGREGTAEDFFRINLFDHPILEVVANRREAPPLFPLMLYIMTHELIHISRLSRMDESTLDPETEEETVHKLTRAVLKPLGLPSLHRVADLYHENLLP